MDKVFCQINRRKYKCLWTGLKSSLNAQLGWISEGLPWCGVIVDFVWLLENCAIGTLPTSWPRTNLPSWKVVSVLKGWIGSSFPVTQNILTECTLYPVIGTSVEEPSSCKIFGRHCCMVGPSWCRSSVELLHTACTGGAVDHHHQTSRVPPCFYSWSPRQSDCYFGSGTVEILVQHSSSQNFGMAMKLEQKWYCWHLSCWFLHCWHWCCFCRSWPPLWDGLAQQGVLRIFLVENPVRCVAGD